MTTWTTYQGSRVLRIEGREVERGRVPQVDLEVHQPPREDGHIPGVYEVDVGGALGVYEANLEGSPRNESQDLARAGVGVGLVHTARLHLEANIGDALRSAKATWSTRLSAHHCLLSFQILGRIRPLLPCLTIIDHKCLRQLTFERVLDSD